MLIEDDQTIAKTLQDFLKQWDYEVYIAYDFHNVIQEFKDIQPDLVLLDIGLPYKNGYYWCDEIRKLSSVPIMFISSINENMNIVMAMNAGADDFVSKPFDLNVLLAKLQAIFRRTYEFNNQVHVLEYKGIRFQPSACLVMYQDQKIELTKNEMKILKLLMEHKGTIVKRDALMDYLWQTDSYIDENTLSVNVNRLRKKLESIGIMDFINTRKGIGYYI